MATTSKQSRNARFQEGSGVYVCRCCKHNTRSTGGDGAGVRLCDLCFELAGEENSVADTGDFYESVDCVKGLLTALDQRNGAGTALRCFPALMSVAYPAQDEQIIQGPKVQIQMSLKQAAFLSQLAAYAADHMTMLPETREEARLMSGMLEPEMLVLEGTLNDFTA